MFTPIGFFSIVAHKDIKKSVLVRSRAKADLEKFRDRYCKRLGPITFLDWSDYPYRATVGRWAFAHAMFKIALDLSYTNFKSAVKDNKRHNVYMRVWTVMREAERKGDMGDKQAAKRGRSKVYHGQRDFNWAPGVWNGLDGWLDKEARRPQPQPRKTNGRFAARDSVPELRTDPPPAPLNGNAPEEGVLGEREEQMARDAGMFDDDLVNDPFGWDDGLGNSSRQTREDKDEGYDPADPDDDGPDRDDPGNAMEFDSLGDVIDHFKSKD